jgi:UDP-N-acetyl-D-glucosamine dehydrogenase
VLNTKDYPLTVMDRPIESETTKIVENSYRATILAYLNEWSLFAERNGVDLIKVINAIKMRPTHSNMIFPGTGHRWLLSAKGWWFGLLGLPPYSWF